LRNSNYKEDFLKIPEKEFIDKYIEENLGEYQLKKTPCCFLKEENECIY